MMGRRQYTPLGTFQNGGPKCIAICKANPESAFCIRIDQFLPGNKNKLKNCFSLGRAVDVQFQELTDEF